MRSLGVDFMRWVVGLWGYGAKLKLLKSLLQSPLLRQYGRCFLIALSLGRLEQTIDCQHGPGGYHTLIFGRDGQVEQHLNVL